MDKSSLGDRMKRYEEAPDLKLVRRMPVVLRADGKAFHTFTRGMERPFDDKLLSCMDYAAYVLCSSVENCVFGYTQSDEISILLVDYKNLNTECWYDYRVQKVVSVASSIVSIAFANAMIRIMPELVRSKGFPAFDCRAYNVPADDVTNYFLWRQRDATRNSILSVGQKHFSHSQLQNKNVNQIQDMLMMEKGINWNDETTRHKRGAAFFKRPIEMEARYSDLWVRDLDMPIISQDRGYIDELVFPEMFGERDKREFNSNTIEVYLRKDIRIKK